MERFGITVSGQLREWLLFAATGAVLGVWYDLFRVGRLFFKPSPWRVFFQDVTAAAGAAFITMLAALPVSNGQVRMLHLVATALGFAGYYITFGRIWYAVLRWGTKRCCRIMCAVGEKWRNFKRKCENRQKSFKNPLQPTDDV